MGMFDDLIPQNEPTARITVRPEQSSNDYAGAISKIESGGRYDLLGPVTKTGDRAFGKYQVMGANVPEWTRAALGQELSPQQFLSSPQAQDAVFQHRFGSYVDKYGPEGAAKAWFAGEGGMNNPNAKDQLGTSVSSYGQQFMKHLGSSSVAQAATTPQQPPSGGMFDDLIPGAGQQQAAPQAPVSLGEAIAKRWQNPSGASLMGMGKSMLEGAMAPGAALQGQFNPPPQTPGMLSEEDVFRQDIAKQALEKRGGDLAMLATGGDIPAVASRAAASAIKPVTNEALRAASSDAFKSPVVNDLKLVPETMPAISKVITERLNENFDPLLAPTTYGLLEKFAKAPEGPGFVSGSNLQTARRLLGEAAGSANSTERKAAKEAIGFFDDIVSKMPERAVVGGDAKAASETLAGARGDWAAASRDSALQKAQDRAGRQSASAGTGANTENALRQQVKALRNNDSKMRGFSAEEKAALDHFVSGGPLRNTLRAVEKLMGGELGLTAIAHAAVNPVGIPTVAAGYVLRKLGERLANKEMDKIHALLLSRSPYAKSLKTSMESWSRVAQAAEGKPTAAAIAALTIQSRNLSNNLKDAGVNMKPDDVLRLMAPANSEGTSPP